MKFVLGAEMSLNSHFWSRLKPDINWKMSMRSNEVTSCDLVNGIAACLRHSPTRVERRSLSLLRPGCWHWPTYLKCRNVVMWKNAHTQSDEFRSRTGILPLMEKLSLSAWNWRSSWALGSCPMNWSHRSVLGARVGTDESQEAVDKWSWPEALPLKQQQMKWCCFLASRGWAGDASITHYFQYIIGHSVVSLTT